MVKEIAAKQAKLDRAIARAKEWIEGYFKEENRILGKGTFDNGK